jgi:hypothetical protein
MKASVSRALAVSLALGAVVAAYGIAARARNTAAPAPLREMPAIRAFHSVVAAIRRDPFSGAPNHPHPAASPMHGLNLDDFADFVALAGSSEPPPAETEFVLKATIVGAAPVAYLASGTAMRIVRVGDMVGGRKVDSIDARGIELSGSMRLELAASATPHLTSAPRRASRPPFNAARVRDFAASSTSASSAPSLAGSEPPTTPGPPPTIRPGAYPLGSRPSSDPSAPTALPYPYPYPPK